MKDYPPDIQAKVGTDDRTDEAPAGSRHNTFSIVALGILVWSTKSLTAITAGNVTFAAAFAHFSIMLDTFNLLG